MGAWDPRNVDFMKSLGVRKGHWSQLARNTVACTLKRARYTWSWKYCARFIKEPYELQAQVCWLKRALLENEQAASEWREMGRSLPLASEVLPGRMSVASALQPNLRPLSSRFLWLNPSMLAAAPAAAEEPAGAAGSPQRGELAQTSNTSTSTAAAAHADAGGSPQEGGLGSSSRESSNEPVQACGTSAGTSECSASRSGGLPPPLSAARAQIDLTVEDEGESEESESAEARPPEADRPEQRTTGRFRAEASHALWLRSVRRVPLPVKPRSSTRKQHR
jgi:hypothetical protein